MIQMFHLTKSHGSDARVLQDAFFSAAAGSFTVVAGESRAGKSTFLRILCGEEEPNEGVIRVNNVDLSGMSPSQRREWLDGVGLIFPDLGLMPGSSVEDNLTTALRIHDVLDDDHRRFARELLDRSGLAPKAGRLPEALSFSEQRLASALRAFVARPRLLLADEPFQGLDRNSSETLAGLLSDLNRKGATVVLTAHAPPPLPADLKVQWALLKDGRLSPCEAFPC